MIKKGDIVSIALIMANVIFVCLLVSKGSFISPNMAAGDPDPSPSYTIIPDIMLTVTPCPSPTVTLAVNDGALLFAEIRSQPREEPTTPTVSPSPSPGPAPDTDDDDNVSPVKRPSYSPTPQPPAVPSYRKIQKPHPKHR